MLAYVGRRLLSSILLILGLTVVTFIILNAMPGDPAEMMISPLHMSQEAYQAKRELLGLDRPLPVRYVNWLSELSHGNLGYSYVDGRPVLERVGERLMPSLQLVLGALLVAILVSVPLGIIAAVRKNSRLDYTLTGFTLFCISIPSFFLGLLAIYVLALKLDILPVGGMYSLGGSGDILDRLRHLVMPVLVLGLMQTAVLTRYMRSSMLEVLNQDFIRTARAKGLRERLVLFKHALRNAIIPIITVVAVSVPQLFGGAVITEQIFQWPGIGSLTLEALAARDYPILMGINLLLALMVFVCNLAADLLYAAVDPRIRYD